MNSQLKVGTIAGGLICIAAGIAGAQDTIWPRRPPIIVPPRPIPPREQELDLKKQSATVKVTGQVAKVSLVQEFANPTDRQIEGTYLFPVPSGAAVGNFAMTVDGKRLESEVLEGDKARGIYEEIVRKLRDPGILEFSGQDVLKARIFPIAPRATVKVELTYSATLKADGAGYRLTVPQKLPIGGAADSSTVQVEITGGDVKGAYSPTHQVQVNRGAETTKISGEWNAASTDQKDFVLLFTKGQGRVGLDVTVFRPEGEDPYFLLLAAPDSSLGKTEVAAKDVVFVFDTSGSMMGPKIEQARKALLSLLGNLNPGDRFNIITFSSDVRSFKDGLRPAEKGEIQAAREFINDIKAVGGTDINEAVTTGLTNFTKENTRPRQMVFLTDGQPTVGETRIETILKNSRDKNASGVRLFVFGVGNDVNTKLPDSLAEENRGSTDYVSPEEDIETKVGTLYKKIAYPVLTNPVLKWTGNGVYDVYPNKLPDLFLGTQALVFGRLRAGELRKVSLSGEAGGKTETVSGSVAISGQAAGEIPRLWAVRKVGYLLDDARRNNRPIPDEVKDEIIKLSKRFGIITPLTAGLITEDSPSTLPMPRLAEPRTDGLRPQFGPPTGNVNGAMDAFKALAPSAPQSGAGAVAASRAIQKMRAGEQAEPTVDGVKTVAGKTFVLRGEVWTDADFNPQTKLPEKTVKFASTEYFALSKNAKVVPWLSVGDRVVFVYGGEVIRIEP